MWVKNHGGFVKVFSEEGKGTEFQVYLPVSQTIDTKSVLVHSQECASGQGELILLIDDEDSIRETTKTLLEKNGYQVLVARDGIEAIALYTQHKTAISVVLIDIMMPSMDGSTTIRILKRINPELKIIGVSGLVSTHEMIKIVDKSVATMLPKPYTSEELLENLHFVLNSDLL
jgi:two-component system cell cycle sensor histidine kinase/response regulator CckA